MSMPGRHAIRVLARSKGAALVAVLSLAVGIGVNTAVFSFADALFLRPLAVHEPDRLAFVVSRAETGRIQPLSFPEYEDLRRLVPAFEGLAAFDQRAATYRDAGRVELFLLSAVSANYFDVLGVHPESGRVFDPARDEALDAPPVVISHSLWTRRFGADPALVNRTLRLSEREYTVIGILPAAFTGLERGPVTDLWIDLDAWSRFYGSRGSLTNRAARHFEVIARLSPGARIEDAEAPLKTLGERWAAAYPEASRGRALLVRPAGEVSGGAGRSMTLLLLAIVGLVLIIAAVNAATLIVAQVDARRREFGIRLAIGAGYRHLVAQLLAEGAVLAATGTGAGLLLAWWLIDAAPALAPSSDVFIDYRIALDRRVLAFTAGIAAVTAVIMGLAPVLGALRTDLARALTVSPPGASRGRLLSLRTGLVMLQVALAVVLINSSTLLLRSFLETRGTWLGFDWRKPLLIAQLSMGDEPGGAAAWPSALERIRERIASSRGVRRATYVRRVPMAGYGGGATLPVSLPGGGPALEAERELRYNQVGPGYLETLGTRLLRGRFFAEADQVPTARVVVIGQTLARQYFPDEDPIGRFLRISGIDREVIGLVEDARITRIHEAPEAFLLVPYSTNPSRDVALVVEPAARQEDAAAAVASALREFSPRTLVLATTTMERHVAEQLYLDRMPALLGAALSAVGIVLAAAGLYATVAFLTGRRVREFGIRMALGARPRTVLALVMGQGLAIAVTGGAAGVIAALIAARPLRNFLHGISSDDPVVLGLSALAAMLLGAAASIAPAWRAIRIDPASALRDQ